MVLKRCFHRPNEDSNEGHFGARRVPMRPFHQHYDLFSIALYIVDNPLASRHPQFRVK